MHHFECFGNDDVVGSDVLSSHGHDSEPVCGKSRPNAVRRYRLVLVQSDVEQGRVRMHLIEHLVECWRQVSAVVQVPHR